MFSLDMRTAIFSYVFITIISTFVITLLLKQYRSRYNGVQYMAYCFALQTLALTLILLRGNIPDWISFDLSNTISVAGIMLFYIGIESYSGKKNSLKFNLILLITFASVNTWFTFGKPDLAARHLNVAIVWLLIFVQCTWLLLVRVPRSKVNLNLPVSLICLAFCFVCIVRIIKFFVFGHNTEGYFNSDWFDTAIIIICQVLMILLIYSLEHMFGSRLLQDIKLEEEKFSKAFHSSPYAVALTHMSDGKIIEINKGVENITGYSYDDVQRKTSLDLKLWYNIEDRNQIIEELLNSGKVSERELLFRKKSGEKITVLYSGEVLTVNDKSCLLSSFDDITERKKYESELIKAKEKAEENDKLKTAFLQNISHEIRTPLNAIVGFSNLLAESDLTSERKLSYINIINQSSDHLLSIVNDLLEIKNIESGKLDLNKSEINLNNILSEILKQFAHKLKGKEIVFRIVTGLTNKDANILTDRTKLVQILSNLLDNAIKFTATGHIELGYKLKKDYLEFHVSDTGIGIPLDKHSKIFERFYQVDYSSSRPYNGTGLGLSILKSYIDLLDGNIWLESEPGEGTTFFFTIPYLKAGVFQET